MFTCQNHGWVYNQGRRCPNCFRERINFYQNYLDNSIIDSSISTHLRRSEFDIQNPSFINSPERTFRHDQRRNLDRHTPGDTHYTLPLIRNRTRNRTINRTINRTGGNVYNSRNSPIITNTLGSNRLLTNPLSNNLPQRRFRRRSILSNYRSHSNIIASNSNNFINTFNQSNNNLRDKFSNTSEFIVKNKINNYKCSICLNNYLSNEKIRILPCMHYFHSSCVDKWFHESSKCPLCQYDILK